MLKDILAHHNTGVTRVNDIKWLEAMIHRTAPPCSIPLPPMSVMSRLKNPSSHAYNL